MPQPIDYFGLMGGAANIGGVNQNIQQTLLGQQNIQQNANVLAQQQRAQDAQRAMSDILLAGGGPSAQPALGSTGGSSGIVATPEQKAEQAALEARYPDAPKYAPETDVNAAWERLARADPAAASALRTQMIQRQQIAAYNANPTARATLELFTTQPELKDALEKGWEFYSGASKQAKLNALADAKGYLDRGDTDGALKIAREHMEADKAAGLDINGYQQIIDAIQSGNGLAIVNPMLAAGAGPEKFAEAYGKMGERQRADELQPALVRKGVAEASQAETTAQFAPATAQSNLDTAAAQRQRMAVQNATDQANVAIARSRLDLDRDTLESNVQLKLEELDRKGAEVDAGGRQVINTAVGNSVAASALADRMNNLADRMKGSGASSGWKAAFYEKAKGAFGEQDVISGLRSEYNQLVNQQAVKNLPPGPASDKDIALAKQGFPPDTANTAYLESFLRGMAKMQQAVAAAEDRKASWVATNGSLAPARRDMDVGGVQVPAGTTYSEFNGNAVKRGRQGDMPAGLTSVLDKYGRR